MLHQLNGTSLAVFRFACGSDESHTRTTIRQEPPKCFFGHAESVTRRIAMSAPTLRLLPVTTATAGQESRLPVSIGCTLWPRAALTAGWRKRCKRGESVSW